jgi:hypothetical protein
MFLKGCCSWKMSKIRQASLRVTVVTSNSIKFGTIPAVPAERAPRWDGGAAGILMNLPGSGRGAPP